MTFVDEQHLKRTMTELMDETYTRPADLTC